MEQKGTGGASYRDLLVWQKAVDLVEEVYLATRAWPREELYGLTNQVRRAVVSVPANIAEGQGRNSRAEFMQFLAVARGSLHEVETHLVIARRLQYLPVPAYDALIWRTTEVARLISGLSKHLRGRTPASSNN
ncbi:MAG TPA: four helix bundle protein [Thermomicrobiales bacterium]|nr:four helix bundle protein [Thermomicrobiales bacterium]